MKEFSIVLLARNCDSTNFVYNYLEKHFGVDIVVFEDTISKKEQFFRRVRLIGFWRAVGQVFFMLFAFPFLKLFSQQKKRKIIEKYGLDPAPVPESKVKRVKKLSSEEGRKLLQHLNPQLLVVNGTRIISKKTLKALDAPFINIHTGITPAYRGVHGGYWSIAKGHKNLFGTTIHYVDPGVDTGGIIAQVFKENIQGENFYTYPYIQYAIVLPKLQEVVDQFRRNEKPVLKEPVTTESNLWFHPTLFQWILNLKKTFIFIPIIFLLKIIWGTL